MNTTVPYDCPSLAGAMQYPALFRTRKPPNAFDIEEQTCISFLLQQQDLGLLIEYMAITIYCANIPAFRGMTLREKELFPSRHYLRQKYGKSSECEKQIRENVMLRKLFALVVSFLLLSEAVRAEAQEPLELIEKAIAVRGGKDKLSKYQASTVTTKGTIAAVTPNGTIDPGAADFTATWYFHYPDRFRAEYQITVDDNSNNMVQVFNGETFWVKLDDAATMESPDHMLKAAQAYFQVQAASQLVPLLNKERYTVSSAGEFKVNEKRTIGLKVNNKTGLDMHLYFDPKTHVILKQEYHSKNFVTGKDALFENYLSNYKKIDGILESMRWEVHFDGKELIAATIESVQHHVQLDASLFEKPE